MRVLSCPIQEHVYPATELLSHQQMSHEKHQGSLSPGSTARQLKTGVFVVWSATV